MVPIPTPLTDPRNLADWIELRALLAADKNSSFADLRRVIVAASGDGPRRQNDEALAASAFSELSDREIACGGAYPFQVLDPVLQARDDLEPYWGYRFCLFLSLFGANRGEAERQPTELFEEVAGIAAQQYISGRSLKFGFPRRVMPAGFVDALSEVCAKVGEGVNAKRRPDSIDEKDAHLDIVAWKPFPDGRRAQLILFGQCAAGGNWDEKVSEMQPRVFTDLYWTEAPAVEPIKAFFTPFRLPADTWYKTAKSAGIVFDRCRLAHWVFGQQRPPGLANWSRFAQRSLAQ